MRLCRFHAVVNAALLVCNSHPYARCPGNDSGNVRAESKSGGYSGGVPPLPIPNREVKPAIADGTAMQCGRVGSRLLYFRESPGFERYQDSLFLPF